MRKMLLMIMIIAASMMTITLPAHAAKSVTIENIIWTLDDNGTMTVSGEGQMSQYPYYTLCDEFNLSQVKKLVIEDGITNIPKEMFALNNASLESVEIPESVISIGYAAFCGCENLTSIKIGENVETIETMAFYATAYINDEKNWVNDGFYIDNYLVAIRPNNATEFTIKEGTTLITNDLFKIFTTLTKVKFPESLRNIGANAFYGCTGLTNISIPDGVEKIGACAFRDCTRITDITIGKGLRDIRTNAFYKCENIKNVYISDLSAWCKIKFEDSTASPLLYAENLYLNKNLVTSITIPNDITSIGNSAFCGYGKLTSVTISDSVIDIGTGAFGGCEKLTSVKLGNGVKSIGGSAFSGTAITRIDIPSSVTSLGDYAFANCKGLTDINIGENIINIGSWILLDSGYYNNLQNWENGVLYVGEYLVDSKNTITGEYAIKAGTKVVAASAFYECSKLKKVTIPDSVKSIGRWAFWYTDKVEKIKVPESVTFIDTNAFNPEITLCGYAGSAVSEYAKKNNSKYIEIAENNEMLTLAVNRQDGKIGIRIAPKTDISAKAVYAAIYDISGKMIAILGNTDNKITSAESVMVDDMSSAAIVKVFVLNSMADMKPLCKSAVTIVE